MELKKIETAVAAARQSSEQFFSELVSKPSSQSAGMLQSNLGQIVDNMAEVDSDDAVENLGQIVDNMAEVDSADAVDQNLELFLDDIVKSTIDAHSSQEPDGLYQPLIDILA